MRVGIVAFLQESNTFLPQKTTLEHFRQDLLCEGPEILERFTGSHHEVGGFIHHLQEANVECVPIFAARAIPYGTIEEKSFQQLLNQLAAAITKAGPIDGLLVAPHGATVAEGSPDADGTWLSMVREQLGPQIPIIGTLDLHANLSPKMVNACDALIAYQSNPHLDQFERGKDAARLMTQYLQGQIARPTMAAEFPPMAVNIERQSTHEPHFARLYELARSASEGLLSTSLVHGFPYADVAEMGASVIAVSAGDRPLAERTAKAIARDWWQHREEFAGVMIDPASAVAEAGKHRGPVCLLDMGDNVGGGSPGDGTILAHELLRQNLMPACVVIADPEAVKLAVNAGSGNRLNFSIGGKTDLHGPPLTGSWTVQGIYPGKFQEQVARHGGFKEFDQGQCAVVVSDTGLTVLITTRRVPPFSLNQLTSCGIEPSRYRAIVAKGVHAPMAAYAPVSEKLIRVDTPGITSANLNRLKYEHRRRPMFPFEPETTYGEGGEGR